MNRLIPICISLFFCSLLYGQKDSTIWHLSGQTNDQTVKAYFVSGKQTSCGNVTVLRRNVLVFKKGQLWDTLDLCDYGSMLPDFKDTCAVQSIQLDGKGLPEVILFWDRESIYYDGVIRYKFYTIWDLDTKQRIFYITPDYYGLHKTKINEIDVSGKFLDSIIERDSCIYTCDFGINQECQIVIDNLKQIGDCPDNQCWKRREGIYYYEDKKLQWKKLNNGG